MALALRWMIPAMTPAERLEVIGPLDDFRGHISMRVPWRNWKGFAARRLKSRPAQPSPSRTTGRASISLKRPHRSFDAQVFAAVGQAARQQDQPRIEVVAQFGQPQAKVEAQFAVGELAAAALRMLAQELQRIAPATPLMR